MNNRFLYIFLTLLTAHFGLGFHGFTTDVYTPSASRTSHIDSLLHGNVVGITDGDTFKFLTADSTLLKIRIANIDCPERKQPFSNQAKKFTSEAIFGKWVTLEVLSKDRYGRYIAHVFYDGKNLGNELVINGFAWHFVKYSNDVSLQELEDLAKYKKAGLWADKHPIPPWNWRKGIRN